MDNSRFKFRAWSVSGKMYDRVLAGPGDPCSIVWCDIRNDWVNFDQHSGHIMQFTGFLDKNGKELYEGDIIYRKYTGMKPDSGVIVFENACFRIAWEKAEFSGTLLYHGRESEIIGNIYENPELLP